MVITYTDWSNAPVSVSGGGLSQIYSVLTPETYGAVDGVLTQVFTGFTTSTVSEVLTVTSGAYGWGLTYLAFNTAFNTLVGSGSVIGVSGANSTEITGFPDQNNALAVIIWSAAAAIFSTGGSTVSYGNNAVEGASTNGGVTSCPSFGACGIWALYGFNVGGSYPSTIHTTPGNSGMHYQALSVLLFTVAPEPAVVACNAFELQCWLYPLFVFGVYMVLIVGTAVKIKVPSRDMTGHVIEAFALAGFLCVIFGILNITVPLLITLVQVLRVIRE